ncbi:MAG: hypothetical protein JWN16_1138 [Alphaproteobacteria bacterium]|nr:hypothetical protein [Alphaproteobacteria bacterium]
MPLTKGIIVENKEVIARGYGGEPLRRVAVDGAKRVIYITTEDGLPMVLDGKREPTGFPKEDIFLFNSDVYKKLREQWDDSGTTDPLVWRSLSQFIFES